MYILTLSAYSQSSDDHVEEIRGTYDTREAAVAAIIADWGKPQNPKIDYTNLQDIAGRPPRQLKGMVEVALSTGYIDDGYGGREFTLWRLQ